jgi:predicted TIM-barrel fold metal-dependent hydrolase
MMAARARRRAIIALALTGIAAVACRKSEPAAAPPNAAAGPAAQAAVQPWKRPPIIDFHAHLSLDGAERIAAIQKDAGIAKMINLSGGSGRADAIAQRAAQALAQSLPGRVVNFASPWWRDCCDQAWVDRESAALRQAVEKYSFAGLKISKGLGLGHTDELDRLIAADDPRLHKLWQTAGELGIPVSIHVADPRAFWWPLSRDNERWDELGVHPYWAYGPVPPALLATFPPEVQEMVAQRPKVPAWSAMLQAAERLYRAHPQTIFVAVHFGNAAEDLDYVDGLLTRNANVSIDIAARVGEFGRHPAAKVKAFFEKWQDRIVFGTDIGIGADGLMLGSNGAVEPTMAEVLPFYQAHFAYLEGHGKGIAHPSPIQGRWTVDAIGLAPAVLDKLYFRNAEALLDKAALKRRAQAITANPAPLGLADDATPAWAPTVK